MGTGVNPHELLQFTVPANTWFNARVAAGGRYSLAARTAELDIRTKFHSTPRKPGERRMLSYSEMAERLAIRPVVTPEDGRIMNDMNIKRIRAQSSFDV
jgi:hypothetical protein